MKKLLVPTDFSENANQALQFAIAIANQLGSQITLYHVYRVGSAAAEKFKTTVDEIVRSDSEKSMEALLNTYRPSLEKGSLEGLVVRGDTNDLICNKAGKGGYDLIIMGTEGAGGLRGLLLGSTAMAVVRHCGTPVIAIPSGIDVRPIRQIVLAADGQGVSDPQRLAPLTQLASLLKAKVLVFHKNEGNERDATPHPSIVEALQGASYSYHNSGEPDDDISDSIKEFVLQHGADLLCLIRRRKSFLDRLFEENVTRDSLIDSPLPLLIFKD